MKTLDLTALDALGLELEAPFALRVETSVGSRELICHQILRLLPGRRLVARVSWDETLAAAQEDLQPQATDAVLKLFWGEGAMRYAQRERTGLERVAGCPVRVPELLAEVSIGAAGAGLLLSHVDSAAPVSVADSAAFVRLAGLFAHLHDRGLWQSDLNLANFLLADGELWMVDGDGVRRRGSPLRRRQGLANLTRLLAERPPQLDADVDELVKIYAAARGWQEDSLLMEEARTALERERQRRVARFLRKTTRDCSQFAVSRSWWVFAARERGWPDVYWQALSSGADQLVASGVTLKAGNSATVVRWQVTPEVSFVIKRYNVKSVIHGLRRVLQSGSRVRRAWRNGHRLKFLDLPTAAPLMMVQQRFGPLRGVAYLVLEDLGDRDLAGEVAQQGLSEARCSEVVALFVCLRRLGLAHGDTKASNFLIRENQLHLIDLDAMGPSREGWRKDVERFLRNWDGAVRGRFEAAFRAEGLL